MKRLFDFLASLVLIVLFSPVLIGVAAIVALTSPGGALYKQIRIGKGGQPFTIYKFRSMVSNADQIGGHSTTAGDPRITKIGRIIRKTSLDELPQLFNILKGDMSLVGPRPDVPKQEADYAPEEWQKRHQVRPGLTGLAQTRARHIATPEQRIALDLEYVDRHNLGLDFRLLLDTVKQVLFRGSY